jgi:thioredoxin-related protein
MPTVKRPGNPAATASRMKLLHAVVLAVALLPGPRLRRSSRRTRCIPAWFAASFLDFRDEVAEAARAGKRVMIYLGQDGCPYCTGS